MKSFKDYEITKHVNSKKGIKFSICIPAWNAQDWIEECILSISNQTHFKDNPNCYEILVGIDGCEKTLNKLNQIKHNIKNLGIFYSEKNMGTYYTQNSIINKANNENIIIFGADDIMDQKAIENCLKYIDNDLIGFRWKNFTKNDLTTCGSIQGGYMSGVFCVKKIWWDKVNGFSPWLVAADSDFRSRLKFAGVKDVLMKECGFYRRVHDQSLTKSKETGFKSDIRKEVIKKFKYNKQNKITKLYKLYINDDMKEI